jgi:lysophospholipase L1-like esterase
MRGLQLLFVTLLSCLLYQGLGIGAEPVKWSLQKGDRIVFLGDSITVDAAAEIGFQTLLADHIRRKHAELDVRLFNAGISGDKVTDLQARLDRDVLAQKSTVVVIAVGINDVWRGKDGTSIDRYEAGLKDLLARIGKTGARMVLCTPSVIGERKVNEFDRSLDQYAAIVRKVAAEAKIPVCDLRRAFVEHLRIHNKSDEAENCLTRDGVHLNEAGNRLVAEQLAGVLGLSPLTVVRAEPVKELPKTGPVSSGPKWFFRDGDRLYWNGSSHSQDEGWQCSVVEFYLRTRFPQWKISSGRGGPTDVSAAAYAPIIEKLRPTVVFCEFGYYGGDDQVDGVVKAAEKLAALCAEKKVRLVMLPSAFRAAHIQRLPAEYQGLSREKIAELNAQKQKDGTLAKLGQEIPVEIHDSHWRMRGAPGCDQRVAAMQAWGEQAGIFVPQSYQDQRDWLFKVWESDPKFPWGGGHPPKPGYLAVGFFLLQRMEAPIPESRLVLDASGAAPAIKQALQCTASDVARTETGLRFQRLDQVLPVLPAVPVDWVPREPCPVLRYCPYFLTVAGLPAGNYEILVEKSLLGRATDAELAAGVNLNAVYLKSAAKGIPKLPWSRLWEVCRDKNLDKDPQFTQQEMIGKAAWQWELRRVK